MVSFTSQPFQSRYPLDKQLGLDNMEKWKFLPHRDLNSDPLVVQPVASSQSLYRLRYPGKKRKVMEMGHLECKGLKESTPSKWMVRKLFYSGVGTRPADLVWIQQAVLMIFCFHKPENMIVRSKQDLEGVICTRIHTVSTRVLCT
jgi:hypothetical protein